MSRYLCLKWNNHLAAFLKTINTISFKEKYCDATIICQDTHFPVHRLILSTCSNYFDSLFEKMQCSHPYIIFKDIEPKQMELLLNYMYQGEVNVLQDSLPSLLKAAETLRIKGLIVPDDKSLSTESSSSNNKRSCLEGESPESKQKQGNKRRKVMGESNQSSNLTEEAMRDTFLNTEKENNISFDEKLLPHSDENAIIKEEPDDPLEYRKEMLPVEQQDVSNFCKVETNTCQPISQDSFLKSSFSSVNFENSYQEQSAAVWGTLSHLNSDSELPPVNSEKQGEVNCTGPASEGRSNIATSSTKYVSKEKNLGSGQCPHCDYDNYSNLARHIRARHPEQKPHHCPLCGSRFLTRRALERHVVTHTGKDPFQCPLCFSDFYSFPLLNNHLESCCLGRYAS